MAAVRGGARRCCATGRSRSRRCVGFEGLAERPCTHSPATMVAMRRASATDWGGSASGSWSSTTRSASNPGRRRPRRCSSKLGHARLNGEGVKCSIRRDRLLGAPGRAFGVRAQDRGAQPCEWIELLDRGVRAAGEPSTRAPRASGRGRRALRRSAQMRSVRSRSLVACVYCTDAVIPSSAKRAMSSGATHWACSIRWRAPGVAAMAKASSASRLAWSPIACTASAKPARSAWRTGSR